MLLASTTCRIPRFAAAVENNALSLVVHPEDEWLTLQRIERHGHHRVVDVLRLERRRAPPPTHREVNQRVRPDERLVKSLIVAHVHLGVLDATTPNLFSWVSYVDQTQLVRRMFQSLENNPFAHSARRASDSDEHVRGERIVWLGQKRVNAPPIYHWRKSAENDLQVVARSKLGTGSALFDLADQGR